MNVSFAGKVVLVAGGTGGLGRAVSLAFLAEGAKTVVTYRKDQEFLELQKAAGAETSLLEGHRVDVTDEAAMVQLVNQMFGRYGRLDAMVNTVGGYAGGIKLWDLETKTFELML